MLEVIIRGGTGAGKTTLAHIIKSEAERLGAEVQIGGEDKYVRGRPYDKPADYRPGDMAGRLIIITHTA